MTQPGTTPLLDLAAAAVPPSFPAEPFALRHNLGAHPLFTLDRLARLAADLPPDRVEYNAGDQSPDQDPAAVKRVALDPAEVVRSIETCGAWMVLKRVEADGEYRALVEAVLLELARARGHDSLEAAGLLDPQGFVFVTSPNGVTPFHFDPEENVFVQVRGRKTFRIFDDRDHSLVPVPDLEMSPSKHRNLRYRPEFEARATAYRMTGGDGVFVPHLWPHWVETHEEPSVSMAITWKSPAASRLNDCLTANAMLRGAGLPQPFPGAHPLLDAAKVGALRAARAALAPLRRSQGMRRALRALVFGRKANYYLEGKGA